MALGGSDKAGQRERRRSPLGCRITAASSWIPERRHPASSLHSSGWLCAPAPSGLSRCDPAQLAPEGPRKNYRNRIGRRRGTAALQHASSLTYLGRGRTVSPTAAPDRRHKPAVSPESHRPGEVEGEVGERVLSTRRSASCHLRRGHRATRRSLGCFFQSRDAMDRRARPHTPRYISPLRRSLVGAQPTLKRSRTGSSGVSRLAAAFSR